MLKKDNAIFITGINGFVGKFLCEKTLAEGWRVFGTVRSRHQSVNLPAGVKTFELKSIDENTNWNLMLTAVNSVVHLAARTHIMHESADNLLEAYRSINVRGTERLARAAAASGVKRFIFLSSVKVNGEGKRDPYTGQDEPRPEDAYGISKWEAEQALRRIEAETGMEVVVIRPPLVYGPGVKANFLRLMQIIDRGIPLPFSGIRNRRSLIFLDNLVDAVTTCLSKENAAGKTYLVSDDEDVSTPELISLLAKALGRKARLFSVPEEVMRFTGRVTGKTGAVDRLLGNLAVSTAEIRDELNWAPPYTMEQGLKETAEWFRRQGA
jgi:nucleoside-diphosphate-sugar epimerase